MIRDRIGEYKYLNPDEHYMRANQATQLKKKGFVKGCEVQQVVYIQVCWVLMWCLTVKQQKDEERWFRLKQLL